MNTRGKTAIAWLGHPATVIALLILVVNDHILKDLYPGLVTGKLSDAAGLVLAPPLLALLVRRPAAALWSVGVGFTLVKSSGYAAEQASAVWSLVNGPSVIRADLTDLLALPFLAVAWWACRSAAARPVASRWVRALRMGVLLPMALLGVAATSAPVEPTMATRVVSTPSTVYLVYQSYNEYWVTSVDDGATWVRDDDAERPIDPSAPVYGGPSPAPSSAVPAPPAPPRADPASKSCSVSDPKACYRVVPGALGVERSADGGATWASDWRVAEDDRRKLARHYYGLDDVDADLVSAGVAVHDLPGGGHVVLVANRRDGFAMRDAAGEWTRLGFPPDGLDFPAIGETRGEDRAFFAGAVAIVVSLLLGLVLSVGSAMAATRGKNRTSAWWLAPPLLLAGAAMLLLLDFRALDPDAFIFYPFLLLSPVFVVVAAIAIAIGGTISVVAKGPDRLSWALRLWATGVLTGAVGAVPWFLPIPAWTQFTATAVACLIGLVIAAITARQIQPHDPRTTTPPLPYAEWRS